MPSQFANARNLEEVQDLKNQRMREVLRVVKMKPIDKYSTESCSRYGCTCVNYERCSLFNC